MNLNSSFVPLNTFDLSTGDKSCHIRIFPDDLTRTDAYYDIVVCSAYKGDYAPLYRTLIGSLLENRGISVDRLSRSPEIDQRSQGCWLSSALEGPIGRVACVELLDIPHYMRGNRDRMNDADVTTLLKSSFLVLRHLLETADDQGIPVRSIALPILGAGCQGIGTEYIAVPLFHQCMKMFATISSLTGIDFYELNPDRANKLNSVLISLLPQNNHSAKEIFISYSSKQSCRAHTLHDSLVKYGFSVWIAPEDIPAGSDYLVEIPPAISSSKAVVLMLTPDALQSPWVRREITCAIGAGKFLLPAQLNSFDLSQQCRFMFDAEQIMPVWSYSEPQQDAMISARLQEKVHG